MSQKISLKDGDLLLWLWDEELKKVVLDIGMVVPKSTHEETKTKS